MSDKISLTGAQAYEYVMPMKRNFGTSRGVIDRSRNLLIRVDAQHSGATITGWGEALPRSPRLTGDTMDGSWSFLADACRFLEGVALPLGGYQASLEGVRDVMSQLRQLAAEQAPEENPSKPFRGTLSGIDMAVLDLLARAHGVPLSVLLGQHRAKVGISAVTISSARDRATVELRTRRQANRFPMSRIKGKGDVGTDLELMRLVASTNKASGVRKPIWIDVNEGLEPENAFDMVDRIADLMRSHDLPPHVIVEQPVAKAHTDQLAHLQQRADELLRQRLPWRRMQLSIMADESVWDEADLEHVMVSGGRGAINIKIQKVGGVLAALDLATAAVERAPSTEIYIGTMLGTSDVSSWAVKNLAMALPRLDYYTLVPPTNMVRRIARPRMSYVSDDSNLLREHEGAGIGVDVSMDDVEPFVTRSVQAPDRPESTRVEASGDASGPEDAEAALIAAAGSNSFDRPHLMRFKKLAMENHLLELEALRHGLNTRRVSSMTFVAQAPGHDTRMGFYWSGVNETSRVGTYVTVDKQMTRTMLLRAGVAVPEGKQFSLDQRDRAVSYAQNLGYPLVVKPQSGTGGVGVTANIRTDEELSWAIDAIGKTRFDTFVVERHINGDDYRLFVLGDRVLSVIGRVAANVTGDGHRTVADLVDAKNVLRQGNPHLKNRPLKTDEKAYFQLSRQGLEWDSVPAAGQLVVLSSVGSLSLGGDSAEVLDEMHPSLLDMAVRSVAAIPGIQQAGVDMIISDYRRPLDEQGAAICEVNATPGIALHLFPMVGPPRDVPREIMLATCRQAGVERSERSDVLHVRVVVRGHVQQVGYRQWMRELAVEWGVSGWVQNPSDADTVEAELSGPTDAVAAIASLAIGGPPNARPDFVRTEYVDGQLEPGTFEIRG